MFRFITGTIALLCAFVVFGRTQADTIRVYFEVCQDEFNPRLLENASVMERFIEKVDSANAAGAIERIEVYGYSSPEGSDKLNKSLSVKRSRSIANYIIAHTGIDPRIVSAQGMGEAWDELRAMVEADPDVPYRTRVLNIIDNTPEWIFDSRGRIISGRKKQLMDLAGGRPGRWLLANIFPRLRFASTVAVQYVDKEAPVDPQVEGVKVEEALVEPQVEGVKVEEAPVEPQVEGVMVASEAALVEEGDPLHRLAIKTNLLYYGILLPNLEVEWRFNPRWTIALEGDVAWWGKYSKEKSYRLAIITPEVRRWFIPRGPWHGLYVGAFAGGGLYDFENVGPGYRGEGVMGGLSVGYMWPLSHNLSLEAALGAGYLYTRYKKYRPMDGHHVYQSTKALNYVGPLKVKLSLVWRLWDINKSRRSLEN